MNPWYFLSYHVTFILGYTWYSPKQLLVSGHCSSLPTNFSLKFSLSGWQDSHQMHSSHMYTVSYRESVVFTHKSSLRKAHFGFLLAVLAECHMIPLVFSFFLQSHVSAGRRDENTPSVPKPSASSFTTEGHGNQQEYSVVCNVLSLRIPPGEPPLSVPSGFSSIQMRKK